MDKRRLIIRVSSDRLPLGAPPSSCRESAGVLLLRIQTIFGWMAQCLALTLLFISSAMTAHANVYASDIKLNGSQNAAVILPGGSLTISYILNDTATGGVWVRIYGGTNAIHTLSSADGNAGTNAGLNSAIWSGTPELAEGAYTVTITAASAGYAAWTNITDDGPNFYVNTPRGLAVNQNTNSPYYGRVYAASAFGDNVGIFKFNADGSPADEGGFSTGGYGWGGGKFSPWKMAVGADDRLYVDDYSGGVVASFDPTLGDNNPRNVIRTDNYPAGGDPNAHLSGLSVIGAGANAQIWMTDENLSESAGIIGWQIGADGVAATNDTGTVIVPLDSYFLTQGPWDLAVDTNGFIYAIQLLTSDYPGYALLSFPPYGATQETWPDWAIGAYPTLQGAFGVAVDPTATCVAVAVVGLFDTETNGTGWLNLYRATDGGGMTNVDQTGGDAYYDVAWDNVGNLYTLDGTREVWRAYSPPGINQATTVAVPVIQAYNALLAPSLVNPVANQGQMLFTLEGQSNVNYVIQGSDDMSNWVPVATNFSATANRNIAVPASGGQEFYRAMTVP
jgi:hypothetical protein